MSAMMAASAPGPIPVPQQSQYVPPNVTVRGHHRQSSTTARPMTSAGESSPRRVSQNPRSAGAGLGEGGSGGNGEDKPRVAGPTSGPQGRAIGGTAAGQRVHAPSTAQRPSTSHAVQPSATAAAGPSGTQRQPQPTSFRPTANTTRQPEPATQAQPQATRPPASGNPPAASSTARASSNQQPQTGSRNSSFPHAFERWEMLSSRWEGLTGYWVSRLEQNRQELSHLPLEQEMSRQITDLAAAGANLFQALIELQRLRASSERKFQRWFFETRADQERAREMSSELERFLRVERQQRADAVAQIKKLEKEKTTAETMVEETRRELQISREECRRAWEELGRREQEEREITTSLKDGHPALVGGVQVTPMPMPGVPSRNNSQSNRPRTATGAPPTGAAAPLAEGYSDHAMPPQSPPRQQHPLSQEQTHSRQQPPQPQPSHNESDMFDIQQHPPTSTAAATARTTTAPGTPSPAYPPQSPHQPQHQQQQSEQQGFYQQTPTSIHDIGNLPATNPSPAASYATNPGMGSPSISASSMAFETDEHGNIVIDEHGAPMMARRPGEDEDEEYQSGEWGTYPSYDGTGYGSNGGSLGGGGVGIGSGWETIPRHHHPTRLSDVLEEDERVTVSDGRRSQMG